MENVMPDERCYFGCEADAFHTLLYIPPPFNRTPRLCAAHSKSWRTYKSNLKRDARWPEDFWPWADKELETMKRVGEAATKKCYLGHEGPVVMGVGAQPGDEEAALCGPCAESWTRFVDVNGPLLTTPEAWSGAFAEWARGIRAAADAPPSVAARESVLGQWYVVPSGEIEKAFALRGERGHEQVGFLHVGGNPNDPDDIRWLLADVEVTPASDEEVKSWKQGFAKTHAELAADCADRAIMHPALARSVSDAPAEVPCADAKAVIESFGAGFNALFASVDFAPRQEAVQWTPETPAEVLREAAEEKSAVATAPADKLSPLFSSEEREWQTDPDTFAWLDGWAKARWGSGFVLDVCASKENALCNAYLTKERSCLDEPLWLAPWFTNPPYGDPEHPCKVPHERCKKKGCEKRGWHTDVYIPGIGDFVRAARRQAQDGRPGMCLLPYRPDTEWWRECVLAPDGEQVAVGGGWTQGWSWVRWSSGLLVETRLISGRLSFLRPGGGESWTAPFPSVVVVFDRWK